MHNSSSMASNAGLSPAGLSYSRKVKVFGSPWPSTAIVREDGAVLWPMTFYPERWQWWLLYGANGRQVLVGDEVRVKRKTYIVGEIRMGGYVRVDAEKRTWISPKDIGARWVEYRAGRIVRVYGEATR